MSNTPFSVAIAFFVLLASIHASPVENATKVNGKGDAQPSAKSVTAEPSKETRKFAASLNEQENARTHNLLKHPSYGYGGFNQYPSGVRYLPGNGLLTHIPFMQNMMQKPLFSHIFQKPSLLPVHPQPAPAPAPAQYPIDYLHPISMKPSVPVYAPFLPPPPVVVPHPVILPQPVYTKPSTQVVGKPQYVVNQQIIHKPVVTEHVEVVRRPVLTEYVQVVHKPVVHEEVQVVKIPTYAQHVIHKPAYTHPIKNELQGPPIHLPPQHQEIQGKPTVVAPITNVVHVPHAPAVPAYGPTAVYGSGGYGIGSTYKPAYITGSSYGTPSYTVGSSLGYGTPSYTIGSGLGGGSLSYGTPSYTVGSSYGEGSPGYGTPSYSLGLGSGFGGVYDAFPGYSTAGISSGYVQPISAGSVGFGSGLEYGMSSGYVGEGGVSHSYMEPSHGCKSGEDCKPTNEELITEDAPEPSSYSPMWWFNPDEVVQQPNPAGRAVDASDEMMVVDPVVVDPSGMFMVPMSPKQQSEVAKGMFVQEFLAQPDVKSQMTNMFQDFMMKKRTMITTEKPSSEKPMKSGRSSADDDDSILDAPSDKKDEDQTLDEVLDFVKTANPGTLKKIEEKVHELQTMVAKNGPAQPMETESSTSKPSAP